MARKNLLLIPAHLFYLTFSRIILFVDIYIFASGLQLAIYALLVYIATKWGRYLAAAAFFLMGGEVFSNVVIYLQGRTFQEGLLGKYDAIIFPTLVALLWGAEFWRARVKRWWVRYGSWRWTTKQRG